MNRAVSELAPGSVFADRFEVIGTLGRGGMATVYLATDRLRGEQVAIKVLHAHLAHDPAMRRRLRREVQASGLVRHEAALVAFDLHEAGDTLALSMPLHAGTTLTERVRTQGPLSVPELRAMAARVAGALASAHRVGVLHRDVTPNNVMLSQAGDAQLTDFGLARTVEGTATQTSVMGTPGYAAPETYSGQRTDPRSDLYGLGGVLFFAATGSSPFGTGNPAGILQKQLQGDRKSVGELRPDLPSDLVQTIDSLLAHQPQQRPPSAREVQESVQREQAAIVPAVPDTWDPQRDPIVAKAKRTKKHVPVEAELPDGDHVLVLTRSRNGDARMLADNVGRVLGHPPGTIASTPAMRRKHRFRLIRGTDLPTAKRLEEAARTAGYKVERFDTRPLTPVERFAEFLPILIPIIWVAFPFVTIEALGPALALFVSIAATILIPALASPFTRKELDEDLLVALAGDLGLRSPEMDDQERLETTIRDLKLPSFFDEIAREFVADDDMRGLMLQLEGFFGMTPEVEAESEDVEDVPVTDPKVALSRAETLRGRALGNLDLLATAVEASEDLPAPARADLERTVRELRERADQLARTALGLEAALAATPEAEDVSWVHARLTRLETMARAGQAVDDDERTRLRAALDSADSAAAARDELESRLTATLAQLLEIGATATRARADLAVVVPDTATDLVGRLHREVAAVDATHDELEARRRRSAAARQEQAD